MTQFRKYRVPVDLMAPQPLAEISLEKDHEIAVAYRKSYLQTEAPDQKLFLSKYPIGVTWSLMVEVLLKDIILDDSSASRKLAAIQSTYLYSVDQTDEVAKDLTCKLWGQFFLSRGIHLDDLPECIQESRYYENNNIVHRAGRRYSLDFFSKLLFAFDISEILQETEEEKIIFEIGGGFAQLSRLLKLMNPGSRYVLLDIPETLYFAALFLSLNFPEAKVVWCHSKDEVAKRLKDRDFDFLLIPSPFFEALFEASIKFHAALNKSSFGEMKSQTAGNYIKGIQTKLDVDYIFFQNRFLNAYDPKVQRYRTAENNWYHSLDSSWEVLHWEVEPPATRFPYNEVLHHRELYLVAKKTNDPMKVDHVDDILASQWCKNFSLIPFARHSKILVDDFTKGGTLERLVNRVRLEENTDALDALIKYIYLLEGKFPFEERFYYSQLYKKLHGKNHFLSTSNALWKYRIVTTLIAVTGVGYLLRMPKMLVATIAVARSIGIDVGWTYAFLKRHLFREKK